MIDSSIQKLFVIGLHLNIFSNFIWKYYFESTYAYH